MSEAAGILGALGHRSRAIDLLSVGIRAVVLGAKAHGHLRRRVTPSPWDYFDDDEGSSWTEVPWELRGLVVRHTRDVAFDDDHWDGEPGSDRVALGHVEGNVVGWVQSQGDQRIADGPYVARDREDETFAAVGRAVWRSLHSRHLAYGPQGLVHDRFVDAAERTAAGAQSLLERIRCFIGRGYGRSVLLVGPPGTGKSTAIRAVARGLGLSTLRVEVGALLDGDDGASAEDVREGLDTFVKMLMPEALLLDDIDRIGGDVRLLKLLEDASATGKIVLASANATAGMLGALLRPGRFDEVITFDRLDRQVVEDMLGPHADLADRVMALPMAYVREFVVRQRVLGRDRALAELDELKERAKLTAQ